MGSNRTGFNAWCRPAGNCFVEPDEPPGDYLWRAAAADRGAPVGDVPGRGD